MMLMKVKIHTLEIYVRLDMNFHEDFIKIRIRWHFSGCYNGEFRCVNYYYFVIFVN